MSQGLSNIDDFDFVPPLPDEPPPPLPDSPSPPPLPLLTDEEPPPLPSESPPPSPAPPSPPSSDVNERPSLPDFSPPESPRSPTPPPQSPLLDREAPISSTDNISSIDRNHFSPLSVNTDLELPVVSPVSHLSSQSAESKVHSFIESTSPWQLADSDTQSTMSDNSDNESIEDGEIVSLPDLDDHGHRIEQLYEEHDNPPLPEHPHPNDLDHPPPLPTSAHDYRSTDTGTQYSQNKMKKRCPAGHGQKLEIECEKGKTDLDHKLSPKSGHKRLRDEALVSEASSKRQRREDESDHDDAASSIAEAPPSVAGSVISQQSSVQEFQILDDVQSDDDEVDDEGDDRDSDSSLDYEEIDALLDSGVADPKPREPVQEGEEPVVKEKVILVEKGLNPFEVLPEGWVVVTHNSGMPVYLHKESRVCTLSRPYFLGPGSVRKHDIPISAIPCLQYKKEIEKEQVAEKKENTEEKENADNGQATSSAVHSEIEKITSQVRIESALEKTQETSVDPEAVRNYCDGLFQFKTITVHRFKTWKDRRRHQHKQRKSSRPMLPSDTKLITCPIIPADNETDEKPSRKKGFVLNPAGKSSIGILHEYMQHSMRLQPQYEFKELDNAQTPYSATVIINKMAYGTGYATSKKAAKAEAAKATLDILIPQLRNAAPEDDNADPFNVKHKDLSFFDELKIEDPRVADLCNRAGQPSPYQILLECLKRNFVGDASLKMDMKTLKRQTGEFTMSVGSHSTTVTCKNKREGKQLAAQSILQLLHPHITCWGSLLRLYGTDSHRALKQFQESITKLQSKERSNGPNLAILAKLKKEMLKLRERKAAIVPIGTMKIRSAELPSPTPVSIIKL